MARPAQARPAARLAAPPFGRSRSSRRRDPASGAAKPASPPVRVTIVAAKGVKEDAVRPPLARVLPDQQARTSRLAARPNRPDADLIHGRQLDRKLGSAGRFRDVNAQFAAELLRQCLDDLHAKAVRYCGIEVLG